MLKKSINAFLTAALVAGVAMGAANPAAEAKDAPKAAQTKQVKEKAANALPYKYESKAFGYTIQCPQEPFKVMPASAYYEDSSKQGDVLIFENENHELKNIWIILANAFSDKSVPDLNMISDEEAGKLLQGIMGSNGYEGIMLVKVNDYNKGIYAVTAKVVEIDTDGDGQPDTTAEANSQMAVTFFRGADGERYGIELLESPELSDESLAAYQKAVTTFKSRKG